MWNIFRILLPNSKKKNIPTKIPKFILNDVEDSENDKISHYFNKHFVAKGMLPIKLNLIKINLGPFSQIVPPLLLLLFHQLQ